MRSGLHRQLISSGKGFFWYDPILIAAVPGLWWLWQRHRGVVVFVVGVFLLRAAFFARCWNPDGTVAWGPRYLVPACALLVLGWGELLERIRTMGHLGRDVARLVLGGLAVAGAVVSFASVWVPYTTTWAYVNDLRGLQQMPAAKLNAIVRDRISHQNNDWYWSPIVLNLRSSGHASRYDPPGFALLWWRGGPTVMGVLTLTAGIAGMGAAVTVAVVDDRRRADDGCATKPDQVRSQHASADRLTRTGSILESRVVGFASPASPSPGGT